MTDVKLPNGAVVRFPDSMSRDEIKAALDAKFRPTSGAAVSPPLPTPPSAPDVSSMSRDEQIDWQMRQNRQQLFGREQSEWDMLNDPQIPPATKMAIADRQVANQGRDLVAAAVSRVPVGGAFADAFTAWQAQQAGQRIAANQATPEDYFTVAIYNRQAQIQEQQGVLAGAMDLGSRIPTLAMEFAMTGGAAGAMGKLAAGGSKTLGAKAAGVTAEAMTRAALLPGYAAQEYVTRRSKGEGHASALIKGFMSSTIDMGVETMGVKLPTPAIHKGLRKFLSRRLGDLPEGMSATGFHGPLSEVLEERVAEILKGVALDGGNIEGVTGDVLQGAYEQAGKQLMSEVLAFSMMEAGARGVGALQRIDAPVAQQVLPQAEQPTTEVEPVRPSSEPIPPEEAVQERPSRQPAPLDRVMRGESLPPADEFLSTRPGLVQSVALLPDSPSRSQFAETTGFKRAVGNKSQREEYVAAARNALLPEDREELEFIAGSLGLKFDNETTDSFLRKEIIEEIRSQSTGQHQPTRQQMGRRKSSYEPPSVETFRQLLPTRAQQETPSMEAAEPAAEELPAPVQQVYDQLPTEKSELESLAKTVGVSLPKKGTKARQQLTAEQIRRDVAMAMANPDARKGLVGEDVPQPKSQVAKPAEAVPPKKGRKVAVERGPRDTSDETIKEGLEIAQTRLGAKATVVPASTQEEKDIEEFARRLGVRVAFLKRSDGRKLKKFGFRHRGVAFVDTANQDTIHEIAGHEIAHASQIDTLRSEFDEETVEPYSQEYYDKAADDIKARIDSDKDLRFREGVATLVGRFLAEPKLRDRLREKNRPVWRRILDRLSDIWASAPDSKAFRKVERVLRKEMSKPEYSAEKVRVWARETVGYEVQLGNIPEDERADAEQTLTDLAEEVWKERSDLVAQREEAKAHLRKRTGQHAGTIGIHERHGRGAATIKGLDTAGRDAAGMFPGVFMGSGYEGSEPPVPYSEQAYDLLKEKIQQPPAMDDPAILEEAAERMFSAGDDSRIKQLEKKIRDTGENAELLDEIVQAVTEEMQAGAKFLDAKKEALRRLLKMIDQAAADVPFMAEAAPGDKPPSNVPKYSDPRLARIAQIPGVEDLVQKLAKDPSLIPTMAEIETQRVRNRANPGKLLAQREQIMADDIKFGETPQVPRTHSERQAKQLLAQRGDRAVLREFADRFSKGNFFFNDTVETIMARDLLNQVSLAKALGDAEAEQDLAWLAKGYRMARAEQGRALSLRDPIAASPEVRNKRALTDVALHPDPEIRRKIKKQLTLNGIDLADSELAKDTEKTLRALAIARSQIPGTWSDMIYEFYLNSILSGFQTQGANLIGNVGNMAWFNIVERTGEAMTSQVMSKGFGVGDAQGLGDLKALWVGMARSMNQALSNAVRAWKYEYSPLNFQVGRDLSDVTKYVDRPGTGKIPGRFGKIVRIPFRTLLAVDEFGRTVVAHGGVALHAHQIATKEGLTGKKLSDRIAALTDNKNSEAWSRAIAEADYQAFQQESGVMGSIAKAMFRSLKQNVPGVRYVIPFSNFLVNSFSRAADLMPFTGFVTAGINEAVWRHTKGEVGIKPNWNRTLFNQALASAAMGILWGALDSGDDEEGFPLITGTRSRNLAARGGQYRSAPPLSIRIGGSYYSYSRIEPFNVWLSTLVDFYEANQDPTVGKLDALEKSMIAQVQDKNYMQGFSDIASMFEQEGNLQDLITNTAVGFVPNIIRQPAREIRNAVTDTRMRNDDTWSEAARKVLTKAELPVTGYIYRYDIWGRKLHPNSPSTSLPFRVMSPVKVKSKKDVLPVDVAIMQWNETHPDDEYNFGTPQPPKGLGKITYEEFATYTKERGQFARNVVEQMKFTDPPTKAQMEFVRQALRQGSSVAKYRLQARRAGREPGQLRAGGD